MLWTVIVVVCFVVLAVIGVMQSVRWKVRHVAGRLGLSEVEFAERFFPAEQRETAIKLRRLLAPYIPVNVNRIQPSDLLGVDLGLAAGHRLGASHGPARLRDGTDDGRSPRA